MRLVRKYEAEDAHQLSAGVPDGHPCKRLHGHRYVITVTIGGEVDPSTGMLMEYDEIDKRVAQVLRFVDHRTTNYLGDNVRLVADPQTGWPALAFEPIAGPKIIETELAAKVRANSTVEHLAAWFLAELKHHFPRDVTKIGPGSFLAPQPYEVHIEEDSRSSVA